MRSVPPRAPGDALADVQRSGVEATVGLIERATSPHTRRAYAMARRQLDAWLEELRAVGGPAGSARVIPLSPYRINERLQALAERAGLAGVSSHSGRRGLAAELVWRGASTTAVQMAGGWRSPQMVARYASGVAVEDGAVARFFGSGGG